MKEFVRITIKVEDIKPGRFWSSKKELAEHVFIDSIEHAPIIIFKINKLLNEEGIMIFDNQTGEDLK